MKTYVIILLCAVCQTALTLNLKSQTGDKVAAEIPLSISIRKIVISGADTIQVIVRNQSQSTLMLDRTALQEPGFSVTKQLGIVGGNIKELHWGYTPGVAGGPSAAEILHDLKRVVAILPNGEMTIPIDPKMLLSKIPKEVAGNKLSLRLEFRDAIVSPTNASPDSNKMESVLFSNDIELDFNK